MAGPHLGWDVDPRSSLLHVPWPHTSPIHSQAKIQLLVHLGLSLRPHLLDLAGCMFQKRAGEVESLTEHRNHMCTQSPGHLAGLLKGERWHALQRQQPTGEKGGGLGGNVIPRE